MTATYISWNVISVLSFGSGMIKTGILSRRKTFLAMLPKKVCRKNLLPWVSLSLNPIRLEPNFLSTYI
jgi:hypothetical protein